MDIQYAQSPQSPSRWVTVDVPFLFLEIIPSFHIRKEQVLPGQELWGVADYLGPHVRHVPGRVTWWNHPVRLRRPSQIIQSALSGGTFWFLCLASALKYLDVAHRSSTTYQCTKNGSLSMDGRIKSPRSSKDPAGPPEVHGQATWIKSQK